MHTGNSRGGRGRVVAAVGSVAIAIVVGACSGGASPGTSAGGSAGASSGTPVIQILGSPDAVALQIAHDQHLYEGVDVNVTRVSYGSQNNLFVAGDLPVDQGSAPWEIAQFVSQGEKFKFFSTAGGLNMWNGVVVRAADASKYPSIKELQGKKLGIPGFGTGTWAAFTVLAKEQYGIADAKSAFQVVEADPGALLGLLEKGDIDATLEFASQTLTGIGETDKFKTIFSFTQEFQKANNQPMLISGLAARTDWLDAHPDQAKAIVAGVNKALEWMKQHPDELVKAGSTYSDWFDSQGVLADPATAKTVSDLITSGQYYMSGDVYTQAWIDAQYKFISDGVGPLVDKLPAKEDVFYPPDKLK